jgi:hypothetical protein
LLHGSGARERICALGRPAIGGGADAAAKSPVNFLLVQNRGRPEVLAEIKSPPVVVKKSASGNQPHFVELHGVNRHDIGDQFIAEQPRFFAGRFHRESAQ